MPDQAIGGRALVTRRAVIDIVRRVTLGSYGVAGFAGNWADRVLGWIEQRPGGLRVSVAGGTLGIRLHLRVAHGLPIAEVARQVDSAVRFTIRQTLDRDVDRLTRDRPGVGFGGSIGTPLASSSSWVAGPSRAGRATRVLSYRPACARPASAPARSRSG